MAQQGLPLPAVRGLGSRAAPGDAISLARALLRSAAFLWGTGASRTGAVTRAKRPITFWVLDVGYRKNCASTPLANGWLLTARSPE